GERLLAVAAPLFFVATAVIFLGIADYIRGSHPPTGKLQFMKKLDLPIRNGNLQIGKQFYRNFQSSGRTPVRFEGNLARAPPASCGAQRAEANSQEHRS
ncbi:hypothetical protein, partial [Paraburkholderia sp.]|uniref:hypothetical protein n=1 Tax=Paraburkholderia sp. TaxID=1926495 RepID=UPI003C7C12F6